MRRGWSRPAAITATCLAMTTLVLVLGACTAARVPGDAPTAGSAAATTDVALTTTAQPAPEAPVPARSVLNGLRSGLVYRLQAGAPALEMLDDQGAVRAGAMAPRALLALSGPDTEAASAGLLTAMVADGHAGLMLEGGVLRVGRDLRLVRSLRVQLGVEGSRPEHEEMKSDREFVFKPHGEMATGRTPLMVWRSGADATRTVALRLEADPADAARFRLCFDVRLPDWNKDLCASYQRVNGAQSDFRVTSRDGTVQVQVASSPATEVVAAAHRAD